MAGDLPGAASVNSGALFLRDVRRAPRHDLPHGGAQLLVLDKVVVHNVHEPEGAVDLLHNLGAEPLLAGPVGDQPQRKGLLPPLRERGCVNDGGLHNLLAGEDAPRDGRDAVVVCLRVACGVGGHERELVVLVALDEGEHVLCRLRRAEELDVRLLVHVSTLGTPTHVAGLGRLGVHAWLAVDGEKPVTVHRRNRLVEDAGAFGGEAVVEPGERRPAVERPHEQRADVREGRVGGPGDASCLQPLLRVRRDRRVRVVVLAKGRRTRVAPASVGEVVPRHRLRHVALLAVGPEGGANLFVRAAHVGALAPGQVASGVGCLAGKARRGTVVEEPQPLRERVGEDACDALLEVLREEVEATDALPHQLLHQLRHLLHADVLHLVVVLLGAADLLRELADGRRVAGAEHLLHAGKLVEGVDRHDARDDRTLDPDAPAVEREREEYVHVVEQLCHEKVGTCVDLLLQVLQIVLVRRRLLVSLWVGRSDDAEVVTVLLLHPPDELRHVLEVRPLHGLRAAQREDVLDALFPGLAERVAQDLQGCVGARDVHESLNAEEVLRRGADFEGLLRCLAAGAPGDTDPGGVELLHAFHALVQVDAARIGLRGKVFKAVEETVSFQVLMNLIDNLHRVIVPQ
eukprot:Rhum_TRINITY_DN7987_c0_g1::Rhum_TRINITY_DN7987_c0_g1_i1::g.25568::m.25568